jgi:BlaI family penicillinase repressor
VRRRRLPSNASPLSITTLTPIERQQPFLTSVDIKDGRCNMVMMTKDLWLYQNREYIQRERGRESELVVSLSTNYFVDRRIDSYDTRSVASQSLSKEPVPPPLPTAGEVAILAVLWRQGASTVREVHEALGKDSGYTTTLKLMQLMFEKGLVVRNERYRSHLYEARAPKEQTQRQIAGDLLKRAFEGSAKSLVLGALAAQPASGKDLAEIRSLLDEFEKRGGKK